MRRFEGNRHSRLDDRFPPNDRGLMGGFPGELHHPSLAINNDNISNLLRQQDDMLSGKRFNTGLDFNRELEFENRHRGSEFGDPGRVSSVFDLAAPHSNPLKRGPDLDFGIAGLSAPKRPDIFHDFRPPAEDWHDPLDPLPFRPGRDDPYDPLFPTEDDNAFGLVRPGGLDIGRSNPDPPGFGQVDVRLQAQQHLRNVERHGDRDSGRGRGGSSSRGNFGGSTRGRLVAERPTNDRRASLNRSNERISVPSRDDKRPVRGGARGGRDGPNRFNDRGRGGDRSSSYSQNRSGDRHQNRPSGRTQSQTKPSPAKPNASPQTTSNQARKPSSESTKAYNSGSTKSTAVSANQQVKAETFSPAPSASVVKQEMQQVNGKESHAVEKMDSDDNLHGVTPNIVEETDTVGEYDPTVPVGQNLVVPVSGFFCKLCHKFYNNQNTALVTHCQSQPHYDKVVKYLESKRQRQIAMALANQFGEEITDSAAQKK